MKKFFSSLCIYVFTDVDLFTRLFIKIERSQSGSRNQMGPIDRCECKFLEIVVNWRCIDNEKTYITVYVMVEFFCVPDLKLVLGIKV